MHLSANQIAGSFVVYVKVAVQVNWRTDLHRRADRLKRVLLQGIYTRENEGAFHGVSRSFSMFLGFPR